MRGSVGIGSHSNGDRVGGAILEEGSVRKQIRCVGFYVEEIIFVWPRAEIPVRTVGGGIGDGILVAMRKLLEQAAISTWVLPPKKESPPPIKKSPLPFSSSSLTFSGIFSFLFF